MFDEIKDRLSKLFAPRESLSIFGPDSSKQTFVVPDSAAFWSSGGLWTSSDWYWRNGYYGISSALSVGGLPTWSGERISPHTAMNHSVVWACRKIISETVGFLPLVMLQQKTTDPTSAKELALDHPMYRGMKLMPNPEMSAMSFREVLTGHTLLQGNGFGKIMRRSGTGVANEIYPLMPGQVRVDRDKQQRLCYVVKEGNAAEKTYTVVSDKPQDILHLRGLGDNGVVGFSVIQVGSNSIGTAISAEKNVGSFYRMGGRVPYILEAPNKFGKREEFEQFRSDWEAIYNTPHRAPILEHGLSYKQIGLNAKDAQLLETRLFSIHEICRWFGVQPHLVGDLSRATFNNIEELALEFAKLTLNVWLTRWEQELWRCVLTPEEKNQNYSWKHNLNSLLRGDFQSRMSGYATMLQNGIASQDEVRALEDWNSIPDGRGTGYHVQLNMQTLPPDGGPLLPPKGVGGGEVDGNANTQGDPNQADTPKPKTPEKIPPVKKFFEVIQ